MSLYNMLHGVNPAAGRCLESLGIEPGQIERLRDVCISIDDDKPVIRVLCRAGGGNREDYPNEVLTSHPRYLYDQDDDFDCTYAYYYFSAPDDIFAEIAAAGATVERIADTEKMKAKTDRAIEAITKTPTPESNRG